MTAKRVNAASTPQALKYTLKIIGDAIKEGGQYVPIRQYAAEIASRAGPRDFLGQVKAIYDDVTKNRWRYVFDPRDVELITTTGPNIYNQILGFGVKKPGRGFGDCDDISIGLSSALRSIGLKTRLVTIAKPGAANLFDHIYPQVWIPDGKFKGWISVDAVGYPKAKMGWNAPASRMAIWDNNANLTGFKGFLPGILKAAFMQMVSSSLGDIESEETMSFAGVDYHGMQDLGLEKYGFAGTDNNEPVPWTTYGLKNFGAFVDTAMPMVNGDRLNLAMEYDESDTIGFSGGQPVVRTKMLEMDPRELRHVYRTGRPRLGAAALSDDGDFYQWTEVPGYGGFFKKLRKRIKKRVRKVVRRVHKGVSKAAKSLIKKLPGGKYLIKVYNKIKKVAMKAVKPLFKILGNSKIAKMLAPIAALIPGVGPVIAVGLYKAGAIAKLMDKFNVDTDKKGRPKFKSGKQAKKFQSALKQAAAREQIRERRKAPRERKHIQSGRLLKKGSARHRAKLRGYGLAGV